MVNVMNSNLASDNSSPDDDQSAGPVNLTGAEIATLVANGYEPIAVAGKAPVEPAWQQGDATVERVAAARAEHSGALSIGLRTGRLVGGDADNIKPEHLSALQDFLDKRLTSTPLQRIGAKGFMNCYRNETPIGRIRVAMPGPDGKAVTLFEFLGAGRQMVAYGVHPDTREPYFWPGEVVQGDPLQTPLANLPEASPENLRSTATALAEWLRTLGYAGAYVTGDMGQERKRSTASHATGKRLSWLGLRERLSWINPLFNGKRPDCYPPPSQKRQAKPLDHGGEAWVALGLCVRDGDIPLLDNDEHDWIELYEEFSRGDLWNERVRKAGRPELIVDCSACFPPEGIERRLAGSPRKDGPKVTVASIIDYAADAGCPLRPDDEPIGNAFEGVAEKFARQHGQREQQEPNPEPVRLSKNSPMVSAGHFLAWRYVKDRRHKLLAYYRGDFYRWAGTHYAKADDGSLRAEMYLFLDVAIDGDKPFDPTPKKVGDVLDALRSATYLESDTDAPCWMKGAGAQPDAREIMACWNGLLHLPTRKLLPRTPLFFATNAVPFDYDPNAPAPSLWFAFLHSIFPDDADAIQTLQEMFGYMVSGDTRQQKAFLLVGPKRSGKGTIGRVLTQLLGPDNVDNPQFASFNESFGLTSLIGKSAAIISDARLDRSSQAAVERVLSITGEDALRIPRKYKEDWHGQVGARFLVLSNELPHLPDASGAVASRFIVFMLRQSFYGREDPHLTDKLLPELPGILNWALAGWDRLARRGQFVQPASSAEAARELEELSSPVGAFVQEQCIVGPGQTIGAEELYRRWESWCHRRGQTATSAATFGRDLRAALPLISKSRDRKRGRAAVYRGLGLLPVINTDAEPDPSAIPN